MGLARLAGRTTTLLVAAMLVTGCLAGHDAPLYSLWAVNTGAEDRVIVLGNDSAGSSTQPALLIPADGFPRSTTGATIGSGPGAVGAILVYDLACTLVARVEVPVGSWLLTIHDGVAQVSELARPTEPAGVELAQDAPTDCPGGAPA